TEGQRFADVLGEMTPEQRLYRSLYFDDSLSFIDSKDGWDVYATRSAKGQPDAIQMIRIQRATGQMEMRVVILPAGKGGKEDWQEQAKRDANLFKSLPKGSKSTGEYPAFDLTDQQKADAEKINQFADQQVWMPITLGVSQQLAQNA